MVRIVTRLLQRTCLSRQISVFAQVNICQRTVPRKMPVHVSRIMRPDDANIAGTVHGGTILRMIEEAGVIISTQHCNSKPQQAVSGEGRVVHSLVPTHTGRGPLLFPSALTSHLPPPPLSTRAQTPLAQHENCVAALARVERTDFLSPILIGEVAHVATHITYTSKHSVEVQALVTAENLLNGSKRVTNKATLWYVPLSIKSPDKVLPVPPIEYGCDEERDDGQTRYDAQKSARVELMAKPAFSLTPIISPEWRSKAETHTVGYSQSSLIHLVGPSDCAIHGYVQGGVTMKLMDEVAGIVAARHCQTNIVTASVDAINFHRKLRLGSILTVTGRLTFTSAKSMEIEVGVEANALLGDGSEEEAEAERVCAVSAYFTYVSLAKDGKPLGVPQLKLQTEDEKRCFEDGKARYMQNKAKRDAKKGGSA
ncbi:cytosolic acyl coenzyme A thioester hydrolase isoform X1 [Lethenteron reissneri]|uniref:cytosolic acyl coenzyme A thioester hydrolase isoform X1 n=1 Tax=Lethenteron reissneri TaxID=7753 RepID=UPI002AB7ACE6|nr:cytosolic acyl coenzyme A thioester hydrolase isoform X1 [Lethenteron reissneri]